jgi:NADH dehydrogenase FAD-containing subunit
MCIGMTPNNSLLKAFSPETINEENGFVKVKPTMQIQDDRFTNIFAAGDVIDHTDVKTGSFAWMQGLAVLTNIRKMINGATQEELEPYQSRDMALIKLILGKVRSSYIFHSQSNIMFRKSLLCKLMSLVLLLPLVPGLVAVQFLQMYMRQPLGVG